MKPQRENEILLRTANGGNPFAKRKKMNPAENIFITQKNSPHFLRA